eukprot:CAMPEP_0182586662 /NCGR_PEP_ID=MMETSP1324-20130603/63186_1 /TAXON_ID=236786 /ORGANISM="Florenciella sp., Strain RCC1587" /LENGTH=92 /DNA_ID=CAMNT_0024803581 /DNA_START=1 /DNA_END=276 /DNA_ORIENTATION=-
MDSAMYAGGMLGSAAAGAVIGSVVTLITPTLLPFEVIYAPGLAPQPPDTITCDDLFKKGGVRHIPPPLGMTHRADGRSRLLYGFQRGPVAGG